MTALDLQNFRVATELQVSTIRAMSPWQYITTSGEPCQAILYADINKAVHWLVFTPSGPDGAMP